MELFLSQLMMIARTQILLNFFNFWTFPDSTLATYRDFSSNNKS